MDDVEQEIVRAELEELRCLIEGQHVQLLRQRHQLEMQRRGIAALEARVEGIQVTVQPAARNRQPRPRSHGNGHSNGHRVVGHRLSNEPLLSSDQT